MQGLCLFIRFMFVWVWGRVCAFSQLPLGSWIDPGDTGTTVIYHGAIEPCPHNIQVTRHWYQGQYTQLHIVSIINLKHLFCESIKWKYFYKTAVFFITGSCFNTYLFLLFQYKGLVMHSLQELPPFLFQALLEAM